MQTATSETEIKSRLLSICVDHYTLRAPCPKGQGNLPWDYSFEGSHACMKLNQGYFRGFLPSHRRESVPLYLGVLTSTARRISD